MSNKINVGVEDICGTAEVIGRGSVGAFHTAIILNANINLIGQMLADMTKQEYLPLALPSPESGPSQEGASILADAAHQIGLIPLPLFELETESQSSFDQDAQVFDLSASKDSLPAMEDGKELI